MCYFIFSLKYFLPNDFVKREITASKGFYYSAHKRLCTGSPKVRGEIFAVILFFCFIFFEYDLAFEQGNQKALAIKFKNHVVFFFSQVSSSTQIFNA